MDPDWTNPWWWVVFVLTMTVFVVIALNVPPFVT
jgi:hypothetical protein